jgi:hypothetical protein
MVESTHQIDIDIAATLVHASIGKPQLEGLVR